MFYNREDQWRTPNEIYANEAQQVKPYYLIMKLPQEETESHSAAAVYPGPAQQT